MATDTYDDQRREEQPRKKGMSGCVWGCLIAFVIVVVLVVLVAFIVARSWRDLVASGSTQLIQQAIQATDLPEEEQAEVMQEVNRVTQAFREKQISMEQVGQIMQQLQESPLIPTFVVAAIDEKYLNASGLSDEEKAEGRNTLNRFVQGMIQQKIAQAEADEVMAHVADRQPDGSWQLRDQVTDEQLRTMLTAAKEKADAAGIEEQVEEIDPSDELRRIVDQAMSGAAAEEPAGEAPVDVDPAEAEPVDVDPADGEPADVPADGEAAEGTPDAP